MTYVSGPWVSESRISDDTEERGFAIIAVIPELQREPQATPTRGMVAWVHSGLGACATDEAAIDTARLIASAPDLLTALKALLRRYPAHATISVIAALYGQSIADDIAAARSAVAKAEQSP